MQRHRFVAILTLFQLRLFVPMPPSCLFIDKVMRDTPSNLVLVSGGRARVNSGHLCELATVWSGECCDHQSCAMVASIFCRTFLFAIIRQLSKMIVNNKADVIIMNPRVGITILISLAIICSVSMCMGLRVARNRRACIRIPVANKYNFQYLVVSENPENIQCSIWQDQNTILNNIQNQPHYEQVLNIETNNGKICFSTLDGRPKTVEFDIVPLNDPMRNQILQADLNKLNENVENLYRIMSGLYRNQHFYYERNRAQRDRLNQVESKLKIAKAFKLVAILAAGLIQYVLVKRMIERKAGRYTSISDANPTRYESTSSV